MLDIQDVNTSKIDDNGNVLVDTKQADGQDYTDTPVYGQLGIAAKPFPQTEAGKAQAMIATEILDGCIIGMRDVRSSTVYGELQDGDTAVYSTDENNNSKILLKGERKKATMLTKDSNDKDMIIAMDGENDKITISGFKALFEMSRENGIIMGVEGSASAAIWIKPDGTIIIKGSNVLIGETPTLGAAGGVTPGTIPSGTAVASSSVIISP